MEHNPTHLQLPQDQQGFLAEILPTAQMDALDEIRALQAKALLAEKLANNQALSAHLTACLLYTSPSPRDQRGSRMPSSA